MTCKNKSFWWIKFVWSKESRIFGKNHNFLHKPKTELFSTWLCPNPRDYGFLVTCQHQLCRAFLSDFFYCKSLPINTYWGWMELTPQNIQLQQFSANFSAGCGMRSSEGDVEGTSLYMFFSVASQDCFWSSKISTQRRGHDKQEWAGKIIQAHPWEGRS